MTIKAILSAKTAADLVGQEKEALSLDELKAKFKATDPRMWSTPLGTVAGLALTHALSSKGKRSRGRYLLGGLAGTAAGYGVGEGMRTHDPVSTTDDTLANAPDTRGKHRFNMGGAGTASKNLIDNKLYNAVLHHPEMMVDAKYDGDVDKVIKAMKAHMVAPGTSMWERRTKPASGWGWFKEHGQGLMGALHKGPLPFNFVGAMAGGENREELRDRFKARLYLSEYADAIFKKTKAYDKVQPMIQEVRGWEGPAWSPGGSDYGK